MIGAFVVEAEVPLPAARLLRSMAYCNATERFIVPISRSAFKR